MIKIINDKPHKSVVKRAICDNCGVTLEYVPNDVATKHWKDYDGGGNSADYIPCPQCNHQIILAQR